MFGENADADHILDAAHFDARPCVVPEDAAVVGDDAEFPADLEKHREAAAHILRRHLTRRARARAAVGECVSRQKFVTCEKPCWLISVPETIAPRFHRVFIGPLEDDVGFAPLVVVETPFLLLVGPITASSTRLAKD